MQAGIRIPFSLGLIGILGLVFALVFLSLLQLRSETDSLAGTGMEQAEHRQNTILRQPDTPVEPENRHSRDTPETGRKHDQVTRRLLFALAAIALVICVLIARMVIVRIAGNQARHNYQASHDPLTGLINRREFELRVERAIIHARAQSATHAVLYMDLERFRVINDTCGHAAGDELLRDLSGLLLSAVRKRDTLGRLGGDEFGMLLENCPLDKAIGIAGNLLQAVGNFRFSRGDEQFRLGISIGVVPLDRSTTSLAQALGAADSACYLAREPGRDRIQVAHTGDRRLQERRGQMQWVARLRDALEKDRFTLYYQPVVPCAASRHSVQHVEILLRLIDHDGSLVSPCSFLPAAEQYNLVTDIDRWVTGHALAWLARETARNSQPLLISINLSGRSVGDPGMLQFILDTTDSTGAPPEQVCFEITESAAIGNITAATGFMLTLRGRGFRFALDDFGSGLSSFAYLKKLPVDFLKIDGMFVRDITSDPVDRAMVRSINDLGHLLGRQTIAEYVETGEIVDELRRMGVDFVQGHACAKPRPLADFIRYTRPQLVLVSR